ncbi:unnamed protein product [Soboliphyme baturini]|uniref:ANK_REP_REGION domain-containing protein n=1 Tax=Soboliphyme baturini TaxID=241478 RepID=A0A183IVC9_9BILA|nr:unnamed protein product [Soboliphyme baturini]
MAEAPPKPMESPNVVSSFLGNMMSMAREKMLGESWWVPSSDSEVVDVPARGLKSLSEEKQSDLFSIFVETMKTGRRYHLLLRWQNGQLLSLQRSTSLKTLENAFHSLLQYSSLFSLTGTSPGLKPDKQEYNKKVLSSLLTQVETHKLWQPVHIAAKLGMLPFFERLALCENEQECRECMNSVCQPEGCYPLHIAIENDHVDLVVFMVNSLHASISQTDIKGQNAFHYAARCSSSAILVRSSS